MVLATRYHNSFAEFHCLQQLALKEAPDAAFAFVKWMRRNVPGQVAYCFLAGSRGYLNDCSTPHFRLFESITFEAHRKSRKLERPSRCNRIRLMPDLRLLKTMVRPGISRYS